MSLTRVHRTVALAIALTIAIGARTAVADVSGELERAADRLVAGDYVAAERIAAGVVLAGGRAGGDERAEAWRIYGLALFFLDQPERAERALLTYLEAEPDAVLDPALVPPEAIRFFEEVRSAHAAQIARHRPRPPRARSWALNLVPPAGQWQNGDTAKAWALGGAGVALIATNVATYLVLRSWCDRPDGTCVDGAGRDRASTARQLRRVNYASAIALVGAYVYGVVDGVRGYRRESRRRRAHAGAARMGVSATRGGFALWARGRF